MRRLVSIVLQLALAVALVMGLGVSLLYFERQRVVGWALGLPAPTHVVEHGLEWVPMRDGVRLRTQVFLPREGGPWPVIVLRNPYNLLDAFSVLCEGFARRGYACVHQDVRGRMGSEGDWYPLRNEREDGLATLDWLRGQPFQNGRWALWGMSYLAGAHWAVADSLPTEVRTLVSIVFGVDSYRVMYERGLFRHDVFTAWATLMPGSGLALWNGSTYARILRARPHRTADEVHLGRALPWYRAWLDAPLASDPLWTEPPFTHFVAAPGGVTVPVLMIGSWYDPFFDAQRLDFERLATRAESKLVVGPWNHIQLPASDLPLDEDIGLGGQWQMMFDWLGHHLRDEPLDQAVGVVETYDIGARGWQRRAELPPAPDERVRFHLGGFAEAQSSTGGSLSARTAFELEAPVRYVYDPSDPPPASGGAAALSFAFQTFPSIEPGATEQPPPGARSDVLSFVSPPLEAPLRLVGQTEALLRVASTAEDTAFGFELMVSPPDRPGRWYHVRDGFGALSHRMGSTATVAYTPGDIVGLRLDAWPIEWTFPRGARLRVDVSSGHFPLVAAHPNVAGAWAAGTEARVATQTLYPGSYVDLPVRRFDPPVLSGAALGTVPASMACTFDIELPGSATDIVQRAQQMIENAGGNFSGDAAKGDYRVKLPIGSIEGNYVISGSSIRFDITKKPMLVPCSTIESFIRDRFRGG